MKRSLIITLALIAAIAVPLCASSGWARGLGVLGLGGGGAAPSGPVYTDCSNIGTAAFYWNGDHSSGTTYGCKTSSTTVNGTLTGTVVASQTDPGTASPESAGNVVKSAAAGKLLSFPVTSKDIFDSAEGQLFFDLWLTTTSNGHYIVYFGSGADSFTLNVSSSSGLLTFLYVGNNVSTSVTSGQAVPDATWTRIGLRWSVSNNKIGIKIGSNAWTDDSDGDAVTTWTSEPTGIVIMRTLSFSDVTYIDNTSVYKTSGY